MGAIEGSAGYATESLAGLTLDLAASTLAIAHTFVETVGDSGADSRAERIAVARHVEMALAGTAVFSGLPTGRRREGRELVGELVAVRSRVSIAGEATSFPAVRQGPESGG